VGPARPFAGMREPALAAWVRLVDDDLPPYEVRLMIFMDALPPSFGALLTAPVPIPTVTFAAPSRPLALRLKRCNAPMDRRT
jgi:hypothetical protein